MSAPLHNIAELRRHAEGSQARHHGRLLQYAPAEIEAGAVLALLDAVEAARDFVGDAPLGSPKGTALLDALARFTGWSGDE